MRISEINIYPVKSLAGIGVAEAKVEDRGLANDRRWMLVDEKNQFLTQREVPAMAMVKVVLAGDGLTFSIDGKSFTAAQTPAGATSKNVKIWTSSVRGELYGDEADEWFSRVLGLRCRLVRMPESSKRKVNPFYAVRKFKDIVSFADGYPFMLIGEASLADLNARLDSPVPMNRFRPNFVVEGSEAFAEDNWKKARIGETMFHVVKPSARCVMTTVDQAAGVKTGTEPLKTLASFRTRNGNVHFGQNMIADRAGAIIRVGDTVEVLEAKD